MSPALTVVFASSSFSLSFVAVDAVAAGWHQSLEAPIASAALSAAAAATVAEGL